MEKRKKKKKSGAANRKIHEKNKQESAKLSCELFAFLKRRKGVENEYNEQSQIEKDKNKDEEWTRRKQQKQRQIRRHCYQHKHRT